MNFTGLENVANFYGGVQIASGLDTLVGQTMKVEFVKPAQDAAATAKPATAKASGPLAMDMNRLASRQVDKITITRKVVASSERRDADKHLLGRLWLECDNLVYTVNKDGVPQAKGAAWCQRPCDLQIRWYATPPSTSELGGALPLAQAHNPGDFSGLLPRKFAAGQPRRSSGPVLVRQRRDRLNCRDGGLPGPQGQDRQPRAQRPPDQRDQEAQAQQP
jgi:hypothetical protein